VNRELHRTSLERVTNAWRVGPYVFSEIEGHGFRGIDGPVYRFEIDGRGNNHEVFTSLDGAIVAAVGERWTGRRSAGGGGVDTAAGWFMAMIGATPAPTLPEMLPPAVEPKDPHCPDATCLGKLRPAMFTSPPRVGWTCKVCDRAWTLDEGTPVPVTET
jgi:hypothetical protein